MSYFDANTPDVVLKSLFFKYDKDGNETLGRQEVEQLLLTDLGLTSEEAETCMFLVDKDGSGRIGYDEFKAWLNSGEKLKNIEDGPRFAMIRKAVEMFKRYDVDNNGALDREEISKVLVDCCPNIPDVESAAGYLDTDQNGRISFHEFLKWLNWVEL